MKNRINDTNQIKQIKKNILSKNEPFDEVYSNLIIDNDYKKCQVIERTGYFGERKFDVIDLSSLFGKGFYGEINPLLTTLKFNIQNQLVEKSLAREYVAKTNAQDSSVSMK